MLKQCSAHLFKVIFNTEDIAEQYMRTYHPFQSYQAYWCPAFQRDSEEGHYHVRNKTKRNQRHKQSRRRK